MFKRIIILISALALVAASSGCSLRNSEITDLFQPPRLGEEQQAVLDALRSVAGSDYTLKYPHTGSNRSAIYFADMDGDGKNEAAAFYTPSGMVNVQLQFFDSANGAWVPYASVNGDCSEIYCCEFADIDGNGSKELAVGWDISLKGTTSSASLPSRGLSIYGFSEETIKQVFSVPYSYMLKVNLNSDAADEIAIISTETAEDTEAPTQKTKLSVVEAVDGAISAGRSVELFSGVSSYVSFISGKVGDGEPAVFIDAKLSDNEYITQIARYDGDGLKLLLPSAETNPSKRTNAVCCMDINQDTIVEFPICSPLPDYGESSPTIRYRTDWCTFENGVFTTTLSSVIGLSYGFYITIYEENRNRITVDFNPEQALYTVRVANGSLTGKPLFSVKRFAEDKSEDITAEGYSVLFNSNGYTVAAKLLSDSFNGKPLAMSDISEIVHPLSTQ